MVRRRKKSRKLKERSKILQVPVKRLKGLIKMCLPRKTGKIYGS